jgi:hypothetical protein
VNRTARVAFAAAKWKHAKLKQAVLAAMLGQCRRRKEPLAGRPHVLAIRFSSRPTDDSANGAKIAIDRLTGKRGGLNIIVDDDLKHCRQRAWWEPGKVGRGFVYLAVYTGETL